MDDNAGRQQKGLIDVFLEDTVRTLGQVTGRGIGEWVFDRLGEWRDKPASAPAPTVDHLSLQSYLRHSAFRPMLERRVMAWTLWHLARLPARDAALVIGKAAQSSAGKPEKVMDEIVRHFAERHVAPGLG